MRHFCRAGIFLPYRPCANIKALVCGYSGGELAAVRRDALADIHPAVIARRVRSAIEVDVISELQTCAVSVLYLRGQRDFVIIERNLRDVRTALPSVRVAEFPCGHLVLQTQPKISAEAIVQATLAALAKSGAINVHRAEAAIAELGFSQEKADPAKL